MSHPFHNVQIPAPTLTSVGKTLNKSTGARTTWNHNVTQGPVYRTVRAASTKNLEDAWGWRSPSTYFGAISLGDRQSSITEVDTPTRLHQFQFSMGPAVTLTNVSHLTDAGQEAVVRQRALMKADQKSVDLSVAFMERKKTADMVGKRALGILELYHAARTGNFRTFGRTWERLMGHSFKTQWKSIPSLWLEWRYGWSPLVSDIHGSLKAIDDADKGSYARYRVTTRASCHLENVVEDHYTWNSVVAGPVTFRIVGDDRFTRHTQYKVRYDFTLQNVEYRTLAACGVTDPLSTAWELIPFSFVVDWFWNVGSYLDGLNALEGYAFKGGCQTRYTTWRYQLQCGGTKWGTNNSSSSSCYCSYNEEGMRFDRTTLSAPSSALTTGSGLLDLRHMADSLSLLSQTLGDRSFNLKGRRF